MYEATGLIFGVVFFWFAMRAVTGPMTLTGANPFTLSFYTTLVFTVAGLLLVVIFDPQVDYLPLVSKDAQTAAAWSVVYSLVSFPLGVLISALVTRNLRRRSEAPVSLTSVAGEPAPTNVVLGCVLLCVVSVAVVAYVYRNLPVVPLLELSSSSAQNAQARILAARGFQGNVYIRNILGLSFVPLASAVVFAYSVRYKHYMLNWLFRASFLLAALMLFYDLKKGPVLMYLLSLTLIKNQMEGFTAQSRRRLIAVGLVVIALAALMYLVIMGVSLRDLFDPWNAQSIMFRLILGQVQPLLLHFEVFPNHIPFQLGASVASFLRTDVAEIPARLVMEWANPWGVASGTAGVFNAFFAAEVWANFGYFGVVIVPVFIGFVLHLMFTVVSLRRTPVRIALLGYLSVQVALFMQDSATRFFYNPEVIVSLLVLFACLTAGNVLASVITGKHNSRTPARV